MTFRTFILGLLASFGFAWLSVVVVPFFKMRNLQPLVFKEDVDGKDGIYHPKRAGRVANGAEVYAQQGCYNCHTQLVRPTYAGNDLFRADWGGQKDAGEHGAVKRCFHPGRPPSGTATARGDDPRCRLHTEVVRSARDPAHRAA